MLSVRELQHIQKRIGMHQRNRVIERRQARYRFLMKTLDAKAKRGLDIIVSGILLIILIPLFLIISLFILIENWGPIFYVSQRVGKRGKLFPFPKFRSMVVYADEQRSKLSENNQHGAKGITFKIKKDPRVTRVGAFLRRFSLDELPQLWSVFVGDMSLVGPRPPITSEVECYQLRDRHRFDVLPGITCIWQVSGRSEIPFEQQKAMDLDYIQRRNFWFDLVLLLKTIPAVIHGKGAY